MSATGLRAFGDLRLSYDMRTAALSGNVLRADGSDANAYVEFDFGSDLTAYWITAQFEFTQATLDAFVTGDSTERLINLQDAARSGSGHYLAVAINAGTPCWILVGASIGSEILSSTLYTVELHRASGDLDFYLDTVLADSTTVAVGHRYFQVGDTRGAHEPNSIVYADNIKVGTTRGGSDLFGPDDFSSGLSMWTSTTGDVSAVANPF